MSIINWFRRFFPSTLDVNVGDYVAVEIYKRHPDDERKYTKVRKVVQIINIRMAGPYFRYGFCYDKELDENYIDDKSIIRYYNHKFGGIKPLTQEEKLELL